MQWIDLSEKAWRLRGFTPYGAELGESMELGLSLPPDHPEVAARLPGSVQEALRLAGDLPDWNAGLRGRECEWVENREWVFDTDLGPEPCGEGRRLVLRCDGMDGVGEVTFNGHTVGAFANAYVPHRFDLTPWLRVGSENRLALVFRPPPRWLGQTGYTSRMRDLKPRFNYTWDWTPRMVQQGVWDRIGLEVIDEAEPTLSDLRIDATYDPGSGTGKVSVRVAASGGTSRIAAASIALGGRSLDAAEAALDGGVASFELTVPQARPWLPNGSGEAVLYDVSVELRDGDAACESHRRRVGFRRIEWRACEGAPAGADPWLLHVNGEAVFCQGVNWTPIRCNFAEVTPEMIRDRVRTYRDMGCNLLRVWGGAVLESESFYDACDEMGLMVWQELPLSSSGLENWPPEDEAFGEKMQRIAESYVRRRHHHASLIMWCGGNELMGGPDGARHGVGRPVDLSHPLMAKLSATFQTIDPDRRFIPTSSLGPRFNAHPDEFGTGVHWDVHGPWKIESEAYWSADDALFRSEVGAPGASPAELIRRYADGLATMPANLSSPLWRRSSWWIDWDRFLAESGHGEDATLEQFVAWSQADQATGVRRAAASCKRRFPRCGGVVIWMGHDCFPCCANTSVLDFEGRRKPAADALAEVFHAPAGEPLPAG